VVQRLFTAHCKRCLRQQSRPYTFPHSTEAQNSFRNALFCVTS
jgi:hypothetical protein